MTPYTDNLSDADVTYDWRHFAGCLVEDPELFFPDGNTGSKATPVIKQQVARAKGVCWQRCEVRFDCLAWALARGESGIWGGHTEEERRAMVRAEARNRYKERQSA